MKLAVSLFLTLIFGLSTVYSNSESDEVTRILNNLSSNYDQRVRPNYGEKPVEIEVSMYVLRGLELSAKKMNWKSQFYFRQSWNDPRLAFESSEIDYVTVGPEMAKKFWQPDTFFPAATSTKMKSDEYVFFRIKSDGTILNSVMVTSDASCPMDLKYFPHDRQTCHLEMESYGYSAKDIGYKWKDVKVPMGIAEDIIFDDYRVIGNKVGKDQISLTSGNYSRLTLEVSVARISGYFCRQFYLPAIIFALVTWLTFWVPESFKIFRGLGLLTSLISFSFMSFRTTCFLPRLDYSTRLEQYINTCLLLSLLAIAEFILVLFLNSHRREEPNKQSEEKQGEYKKIDEESGKTIKKLESCVCKSIKSVLGQQRWVALNIDFISKILYIAVFVAFNIWYWSSLP